MHIILQLSFFPPLLTNVSWSSFHDCLWKSISFFPTSTWNFHVVTAEAGRLLREDEGSCGHIHLLVVDLPTRWCFLTNEETVTFADELDEFF